MNFEDLSLETLHKRKSEKWSTYSADILPAFVAEMDFPLAAPIRAALQAALDNSDCGYAGSAELAPAFTQFAADRFQWTIDPDYVIPVPDVMAGIAETLHVTTARGDGVVINPPVYPPFFEVIQTIERRIVEVPLLYDANAVSWSLDLTGLERAFAAGARAYVLCHPHNPVGRIWSQRELERIAELAKIHHVTVISDEIHAPLAMPASAFVPFLTLQHELSSSVALSSATKAWNIAGLKCGVLVAGSSEMNQALHKRLDTMPTEVHWRIGHFGALGSVAAFREGAAWLDALRAHLDSNRRLLHDLLREKLPATRYAPPDASYLAWIDCTQLSLGPDPARHFLKRGQVALARGRDFGTQGAHFVRLNMGTSSALLREIVGRMATATHE